MAKAAPKQLFLCLNVKIDSLPCFKSNCIEKIREGISDNDNGNERSWRVIKDI